MSKLLRYLLILGVAFIAVGCLIEPASSTDDGESVPLSTSNVWEPGSRVWDITLDLTANGVSDTLERSLIVTTIPEPVSCIGTRPLGSNCNVCGGGASCSGGLYVSGGVVAVLGFVDSASSDFDLTLDFTDTVFADPQPFVLSLSMSGDSVTGNKLEGSLKPGRNRGFTGTYVVNIGGDVDSFPTPTPFPTSTPGLTVELQVEVVASRFFWEYRYLDAVGNVEFTTLDEVHVPINTTIGLTFRSTDVIHGWWIPELTEKIDVIPTRDSRSLLWVDEPGEYAGECSEFCGVDHVLMKTKLIAHTQGEYDAWADSQRAR